MKRQGTKSVNAAGKTVSGGAFAADTKGESSASLQEKLVQIDPESAFKLIKEDYEGSESNWHEFHTYKPSPETARRLRRMFGLPAGNAAGFKIEEYESESGDGWATDYSEHTVTVEFKGQDLLVLDGQEPMDRLRRRMEHSHRDLRAEAEALLELPEHERWVMLHPDAPGRHLMSLAKIIDVQDDTIVTSSEAGEETSWRLTGDDQFLLHFSRDEAIANRPNLAFTESDPGEQATAAIQKALHEKWLAENPDPLMVTYTDYSSWEPKHIECDARQLSPLELNVYFGGAFMSAPLRHILQQSGSFDHVPTSEELDEASKTVAEKIAKYEADLERYYRQKRPAAWVPTTDPKVIRGLFDLVWDPYREAP